MMTVSMARVAAMTFRAQAPTRSADDTRFPPRIDILSGMELPAITATAAQLLMRWKGIYSPAQQNPVAAPTLGHGDQGSLDVRVICSSAKSLCAVTRCLRRPSCTEAGAQYHADVA